MTTRQRIDSPIEPQPPVLDDIVATNEDPADATDVTIVRGDLVKQTSSRQRRIANRAYELAERRGFEPHHELDDWLEAERQIDQEETP